MGKGMGLGAAGMGFGGSPLPCASWWEQKEVVVGFLMCGVPLQHPSWS